MADAAAVADPAIGTGRYSSASASGTENTLAAVAEHDAQNGIAAEIQQKDELIAALIHELEKAVEKLDRYERTGPDRGQSGPAPSAPRALSGSSLPFMDNLQRMVEDWEQAEPTTQLERIESQLAAVHNLVLNLQNQNQFQEQHQSQSQNQYQNQHQAPARKEEPFSIEHLRSLVARDEETEESDEDNVCDATLDGSSQSWDAIKNQLLETVPEAPVEPLVVSQEDSELLQLLSETPAPAAVDFNLATVDVLKKAIEERDTYIIQLSKLVRVKNYFKLPTDWAALACVPTEMQARVNAMVEHMDVQVRLGEVEMSLERARLARERSQIQNERAALEKHLRRLGLNSIADLDSISASTSSTGDRRWMRFIGSPSK